MIFSIYLCTICPTVYAGDSGELTAAACSLGIPHNSGYPLYSLLGKIFCLIPFGNIGFRMNLMSAVFTTLAVVIVHNMALTITRSRPASAIAAFFLAFTALFWQQAISAEVYSLHIFFAALIIQLLWRWDQERDNRMLALLTFVTGLSFGNHMQTVMLAPAVLFIVLSREGASFFRLRNLAVLSLLFCVALSLYIYLPVRTDAGAGMTWGDPNTLDRFLAHVTARSHRGVYVFNMGGWEYLQRAMQGSSYFVFEFGFLIAFATWGWLRGLNARWRFFVILTILFDFSYTVFLNTISLEITAFGHVTTIVLSLLSALGIADLLKVAKGSCRIGAGLKKGIGFVFSLVPLFPLAFNFDLCNQSRNYTAYEHAVNVLRTPEKGSALLIDGDNHVFPVLYARICEGMGYHLSIFDRYSLLFRWPSQDIPIDSPKTLVQRLQQNSETIYLCAFDPDVFPLPKGYGLVPHGVLLRVQESGSPVHPDDLKRLWAGYYVESFYEPMERDYMNRQVCADFHFDLARYFFQSGDRQKGLEAARWSSKVGFDDGSVHSDLGICLAENGFFEEAYRELNLGLEYAENVSAIYNNLGYCYELAGDCEKSAQYLRKAVNLEPGNNMYLNNLGFILLKAGKKEEAISAFLRSLDLDKEQPRIRSIVEEQSGSSCVTRNSR